MVKSVVKVFKESEIRAISQSLGDTEFGLTNHEIDELFQLCGIKDEFGPGTKWKRLNHNLWNQQIRDKRRNRILAFIRKAMKPERFIRDPNRFSSLRDQLNTALSFAGLQIDEDGRISSSTPASTLAEAERRAMDLQLGMNTRGAHKDVISFCKAELVADNYFHAVLEATKSIFDKMRSLTGLTEDGALLVDKALCGPCPLLKINALQTESEKSEQTGFANLIKGTYSMFRNTTAHEARIRWNMEKMDAEDLLSLASMIHRRLDSARLTQEST